MKIVYKLSLLFAVLISVSACKLNQYSTSAITVEDPKDIFQTYSDAERLANGLNSYFRTNTYGVYAKTSDIQGDLFNATIYFGNNGGAPHTMGDAFGAGDYDVRDVWDGYYKSITAYNYFVNNIHFVLESKDAKLSAAQIAQINVWKGNAYFYRAYAYFELAKKFCPDYEPASAPTELGLPFVYDLDVNAKPKREMLDVTMDNIAKDIDSAAKYLAPVNGVVRAITPTADVVSALKARYYLWTHQWAKAIEQADLLIGKATYALAKDEAEMKREWYTDNGPEDIMQLYATITEAPGVLDIYLGTFAGYDEEGYPWYRFPFFLPTQKLVNFYEPTDTRATVYLSNWPTFNGNFLNIPTFVKYRGNPALTSNNYYSCRNMQKIVRISEMYLIKAEAEAQGGIGDPKATLNLLQAARKATPTAGTLADVQNEWARETVGEGMRIECFKRWNILFNSRPAQPELGAFIISSPGFTRDIPVEIYKYTWPIPTNDIVFNENLVQNKGWDGN